MIVESGPKLGDLQPLSRPTTFRTFSRRKRTRSRRVKVVGSSVLASLLLTGAVLSVLHSYQPLSPEGHTRQLERSSFEILSDQPELSALANMT